MLLPFFEWFETSSLAEWMNSGVWQFAVIEAVHLLGLSLLGGALLVVDLRMLGVGLTSQTIGSLEAQARRWLVAGILLMIVTGVPMFVMLPLKYYYNQPFWLKAAMFPIALAFTFTVRARMAQRVGIETSSLTRLVGAASIALWFTVAAAGRWIAYWA